MVPCENWPKYWCQKSEKRSIRGNNPVIGYSDDVCFWFTKSPLAFANQITRRFNLPSVRQIFGYQFARPVQMIGQPAFGMNCNYFTYPAFIARLQNRDPKINIPPPARETFGIGQDVGNLGGLASEQPVCNNSELFCCHFCFQVGLLKH